MKEEFPFTTINLLTDNYEGITIEYDTIPYELEEFERELLIVIKNLTNKKLLWIKLPLERSHFIPLLTKHGFVFHHCNENDITLFKRLIINPIIPTARNHTLGVGVVVINEHKQLLVIKDRLALQYKIPGGYIDNDENISSAAVREVKEETGIEVDFLSVVALGHFRPLQFGESNLYVGCTARALSHEINIIDDYEIIEAKWMNLDEFLNSKEILDFNKSIVKTALENDGFKHKKIEMFRKKELKYELFI